MATVEHRLSRTIGEDGKSQVIVKLTISRSQRPCFKSGVFVNPKFFKPIKETSKGISYGIVPPKKGKLNLAEALEAEKAKTKLESFVSYLNKICEVTAEKHKDELTKEWIEDALRVINKNNVPSSEITYNFLKELLVEERIAIAEQKRIAEKKTIYALMDEYLKEKDFSIYHEKGVKVLMRLIGRWEGFKNHTCKPFVADIDLLTTDDIEDLWDYTRNEHVLSEEYPEIFAKLLSEYPIEIKVVHKSPKLVVRGENSILKLMKKFKAFFAWLIEKKYTKNRPFEGLKLGSEVYGTPVYISIDERNIIANTDLSAYPELEVQRDIFVFQCCTGVRVSDLMRLSSGNISNGVLQYIPQKTAEGNPITANVPLLGKAKELIRKYEGKDHKGRLFPFISPQKYNDAIKRIFLFCGITRDVAMRDTKTGKEVIRPINELASSHMARRCFIGGLYRKVQDPNLICKMSGHVEGSKAFARYRKIDNDLLEETIKLID